MKNSLIVSSVFALVALALAAVVLAGFGALSAAVALPVVALAFAALVVVSSQPVTVEIVEEPAIVEVPEIAAVRAPRFAFALSVASAVVPAVSFLALVLAGFGVVAL